MKGLSKEEDYPKLLEYQWIYPVEIEPFRGWFDFNDSNVQNFLNSNKIHCDTFGPKKLKNLRLTMILSFLVLLFNEKSLTLHSLQ